MTPFKINNPLYLRQGYRLRTIAISRNSTNSITATRCHGLNTVCITVVVDSDIVTAITRYRVASELDTLCRTIGRAHSIVG